MSNSEDYDLPHVADLAMAGFEGESLHEIREEIVCDPRTEQRIMRTFSSVFPQALAAMGEDAAATSWRQPGYQGTLRVAEPLWEVIARDASNNVIALTAPWPQRMANEATLEPAAADSEAEPC